MTSKILLVTFVRRAVTEALHRSNESGLVLVGASFVGWSSNQFCGLQVAFGNIGLPNRTALGSSLHLQCHNVYVRVGIFSFRPTPPNAHKRSCFKKYLPGSGISTSFFFYFRDVLYNVNFLKIALIFQLSEY